MAVAIHHAREKRTIQHKDHVLMALMWSLDPALHRLFMWILRLCAPHRSNADRLLFFGKLPANAMLVLTFGTALVCARRASRITISNVALQLALFFLGLLVLLTDPEVGSATTIAAIVGATVLLAAVAALSALECAWRKQERRELTHKPTEAGSPVDAVPTDPELPVPGAGASS
jgi:hypothetical protein